jgi:hypothetical protein
MARSVTRAEYVNGTVRTAALRRAVKGEKSQFGALEAYVIVIARSQVPCDLIHLYVVHSQKYNVCIHAYSAFASC